MTFLTPDRIYTANGVSVKEYFINAHNTNKISMPAPMMGKPIGVTLHNTNVIKVSGTTMSEQYTRATINGNMGTVRVHFYVDDKEVWQNLPLDYQSWHCGQKGRSDNAKSALGNAQTISVECIMQDKNDIKPEDNAAKLIAYLLNMYDLSINNLYTHNYWCNVRNGLSGTVDELNMRYDGYKGCPIFIRPHWYEFKTTVQNYMRQFKNVTTTQSEAQYIVVEQLGAYGNKENAEKLLKDLRNTYPDKYYKILKIR